MISRLLRGLLLRGGVGLLGCIDGIILILNALNCLHAVLHQLFRFVPAPLLVNQHLQVQLLLIRVLFDQGVHILRAADVEVLFSDLRGGEEGRRCCCGVLC